MLEVGMHKIYCNKVVKNIHESRFNMPPLTVLLSLACSGRGGGDMSQTLGLLTA